MIEVKTILQQTEIPEARNIVCYFLRVVYEDGVEIGRSPRPHVVNILPDADTDALLAEVNANITTRVDMKWPAISAAEWERAVGHREIEHTEDVKAAYAQFKAAEQAKAEERAKAK